MPGTIENGSLHQVSKEWDSEAEDLGDVEKIVIIDKAKWTAGGSKPSGDSDYISNGFFVNEGRVGNLGCQSCFLIEESGLFN